MVPELPGGACQAYVSSSVSEFSIHNRSSHYTIGKNVLMGVGVNGGVGLNQM